MFKHRRRASRNGSVPYEEMGHGDQTVLFLHGLFSSPEHWRPIMEDMAAQYRVVAPQLPIDSQPGRRQTGIQSISDLTDFVEEFFQQLDLRQVVLCGNSLGGLVAIDFCLRHPQKAEALVLAGSAGLDEYSLGGSRRPVATREYVHERTSEVLYNQEIVTDELVDGIHRDFSDRDYIRFVLRVARATRNRNVKNELRRLKLPTLIIWGHQDQITPPVVADEFHSGIENSQLFFFDKCGHAPNMEHPQQFSRLLQEFLMGTVRNGSAAR